MPILQRLFVDLLTACVLIGLAFTSVWAQRTAAQILAHSPAAEHTSAGPGQLLSLAR